LKIRIIEIQANKPDVQNFYGNGKNAGRNTYLFIVFRKGLREDDSLIIKESRLRYKDTRN